MTSSGYVGWLVWGVPWLLPALWAGGLQRVAPLPPVRALNRYAYLALAGLGLSTLLMVWLAPSIRPGPESRLAVNALRGYVVEAWCLALAAWASTRGWISEYNVAVALRATRHPEFVDADVVFDPNRAAIRVAGATGIGLSTIGVLVL
ncbi:MAG: hypothetical protein IV100_31365 [Myxococcales bacterium]|nr:hypothetical protein [Myxococcales bacterium]